MNPALSTPIVLVVFNRPRLTKAAVQRLRSLRPKVLVVVADGPRSGVPGDNELCREVRKIIDEVDWPCEILRNYSEANMGCGARIASGVEWAFQNVEEAIILEDDCAADPTFFRFCTELLERYRDNDRVMQISGANFLFGRALSKTSYYLSRYPLCWGWATWRRAWRLFDFEMRSWKENPERCLSQFDSDSERAFWQRAWDSIAKEGLNVWAYRWVLACTNAGGLSVTPAVNLVGNVGFGSGATHTRSRLAATRPAVGSMKFPLLHPCKLERNVKADDFTARRQFYSRSLGGKAAEVVRRRLLAAVSHVLVDRKKSCDLQVSPEEGNSP